MQELTRASVGGGSGPLIPRSSGFNGGIVFDCPRFARAFSCVRHLTACLCLFVHIYTTSLCHSLRSEFCCWEYALRRSLLVVVRQRSVPCLCSCVQCSWKFINVSALVPFVFVGYVFVLLVRLHPLRGRVRDFIGSGRTGRKFSWSLGSTRLLNALVV